MQDKRWLEGYARLEQFGLSWDLRVPYWHLYEAAEVARQFPNTPIVLNHTGFPWDRSAEGISAWSKAMEALAKHHHVHLKVSEFGLKDQAWDYASNKEIVLRAIKIFGIERCMFASNFPVAGLRVDFATLLNSVANMVSEFTEKQQHDFFVSNASNAITIRTGKTSKPYKGNQSGKKIQLSNADFEFLKNKNASKIEYSSGRIDKNFNISFKSNRNNYNIRAIHPEHQFIEKSLMTRGRYINQSDLKNTRKVAVIGKMVSDDLFQNKPAVGKYIQMQGIAFQIVGVFEEASDDNENRMIYIPINTAQSIYEKNNFSYWIYGLW